MQTVRGSLGVSGRVAEAAERGLLEDMKGQKGKENGRNKGESWIVVS